MAKPNGALKGQQVQSVPSMVGGRREGHKKSRSEEFYFGDSLMLLPYPWLAPHHPYLVPQHPLSGTLSSHALKPT